MQTETAQPQTTPNPAAANQSVDTAPLIEQNDAAKQAATTAEPEAATEEPAKKEPSIKGRMSEHWHARKQAEAERDAAVANARRAELELEKLQRLDRNQIDPQHYNRLDVHEALQQQRASDEMVRAQQAEQAAKGARAQQFMAAVEASRQSLPDIDQALQVFSGMPVSDAAADIIAESEFGPHIAHHLAKNPAEAQRIFNQPPHRQAAELARLETRIQAASYARKTSKAPPPVTTVNGVASASGKPLTEMSMEEYVAARKAGRT